jgi:hypothetical protein
MANRDDWDRIAVRFERFPQRYPRNSGEQSLTLEYCTDRALTSHWSGRWWFADPDFQAAPRELMAAENEFIDIATSASRLLPPSGNPNEAGWLSWCDRLLGKCGIGKVSAWHVDRERGMIVAPDGETSIILNANYEAVRLIYVSTFDINELCRVSAGICWQLWSEATDDESGSGLEDKGESAQHSGGEDEGDSAEGRSGEPEQAQKPESDSLQAPSANSRDKLAQWLDQELKKRAWTAHELEAHNGPSYKTTRKILDGRKVRTRSALEKIARALNVPLADIPSD